MVGQQILESLPAFVGGECEFLNTSAGTSLRGPIDRIEYSHESITVRLSWAAKNLSWPPFEWRLDGYLVWQHIYTKRLQVSRGSDELWFSYRDDNRLVIFRTPQSRNMLRSARVVGFDHARMSDEELLRFGWPMVTS